MCSTKKCYFIYQEWLHRACTDCSYYKGNSPKVVPEFATESSLEAKYADIEWPRVDMISWIAIVVAGVTASANEKNITFLQFYIMLHKVHVY